MARYFPYFCFAAIFAFSSCESEAKKERVRVEREIEVLKDSSVIMDYAIRKYYSSKNSEYPIIDSANSREVLKTLKAAIESYKNDTILNDIHYKSYSIKLRLDSLSKHLKELSKSE
jgi:hypothetical protein